MADIATWIYPSCQNWFFPLGKKLGTGYLPPYRIEVTLFGILGVPVTVTLWWHSVWSPLPEKSFFFFSHCKTWALSVQTRRVTLLSIWWKKSVLLKKVMKTLLSFWHNKLKLHQKHWKPHQTVMTSHRPVKKVIRLNNNLERDSS